MTSESIVHRPGGRAVARLLTLAFVCSGLLTGVGEASAQAPPATGERTSASEASDPRVGLGAGWMDAEEAAWNMELIAQHPLPEGFLNPDLPGDFRFANSDLAFSGDHVFVGNFNGFQVFDVSDPKSPRLRVAVVCPGGQGDLSVHGDLLFMSVEESRGRIDCGTEPSGEVVDPERFRGVRIFDISDLDSPEQVAAVQTCRGSHTHTLVSDPNDAENLYVYVSGTAGVRPSEELEGCLDARTPDEPGTSYWSIDVIRVPLAAPHEAEVVNEPRLFADEEAGTIAGLWGGGDHGEGTQRSASTNHCHDITAYPEIGLAAGACAGNGIVLDITDPVNPVRIADVVDPSFAYWHSATFNNAGTTILFTDEWGGGTAPRCRASDPETWGANALYRFEDGELHFASYYKLPAPQTDTENCVAHNGSLVPVPGRDIKVQAWYQGGISVFDFTDPENPFEIAYFDRGPISETDLRLGGHWSAYWYNGLIYGSEIARGLDVFRLVPSEHLSENELAAANLVRFGEFNAQEQPGLAWEASFVVARAYLDQLVRGEGLAADRASAVARDLAAAEAVNDPAARRAALEALATSLEAEAAGSADATRVRALAATVREIISGTR